MIPCSEETASFMKQWIPESHFPLFMERCARIGDLLYETNKTMNLTRIPDTSFWTLHAADSLASASAVAYPGKKILDIGCGAGFPSLILAAAFPELSVTAVDSTKKKVDYVARVATELGLTNLKAIHARGNELARKQGFAGCYDFVTARAVSDVVHILREANGFLKHRGQLCIYRTEEQAAEEKKLLMGAGIRFRTTPLFELPEKAGSRLFLMVDHVK